MMLEVIKSEFLEGCRPFIGLDGCHLKDLYGGIFMCAIILDANRDVLSLAFAIVEYECGDSWRWFLQALERGLDKDMKTIPGS